MTTAKTPKGRKCEIRIKYYGTANCEIGALYYGGICVAGWSYYNGTRLDGQTLINADNQIDQLGLEVVNA